MASDGKKKKKPKGKTLALTEFLGEEAPPAFVSFSTSHSSWAEETEDVNPDLSSNPWSDSDGRSVRHQAAVDRSMLPTAPRAAREQASLDMSRLPKEPPFTAFIGNLPYDCENSDIEMFFEKSNEKLSVKSVRLPKDVGGRLKGFGYAEFEDVQTLIKALSLNDQLLKNRKVRVDIAGATQSGDRDRDRDRSDRVDRSDGEWTRGEEPPPDTRGMRRGDSGEDQRGRDRRYGGDDYGRGRERRYDSDDFGRGRDRRYEPDEYGRGRDRRYESDDHGRGGDRRYDSNDYGNRDRRYPESGDSYERGRGRRYNNPGEGYERGDRDGRDDDRRTWRRDDDKDRMSSDNRFEKREAPQDRPRLQLKPRSVSSEGSELSPSTNQSSIFGSAKPVDTATKERQIEERLRQEGEKKKEEEGRKKQEEEEKPKKQASIFGNAKPVDTALKEREIEERIRQREDGKKEEEEKKKDGDRGRRRDEGRGLGPAWRSEKDRERDRGKGRGRGRGRDDGKREEKRDERQEGERRGSGGEKDGKVQYEEPQQDFSMPSKYSALHVDEEEEQAEQPTDDSR